MAIKANAFPAASEVPGEDQLDPEYPPTR